ncbi:pyridoxal phosphate-dependent aminotransferase [Rhizobium puerariae]|uniref:Aminotransferase n=1 Tax=Rhizobium puerariae TaxID=1585791 RepID=A0ABV6AF64_9HYPH
MASALTRASRISSIGVSEILVIGETARRMRRAGKPVIVLGAGEPDFDTPDNVKEAAVRAIRDGRTKYTALDGTPEMKAAIIGKFRRENALDFEPAEIMATAGAKQVLFNAFMATMNPGDEALLAAPYWTTYADIAAIAGGTPVALAGREENGFRITAEDLEAAITPRTRWLLLNSPSNPSGAAYEAEHLKPILDVLLRHPHVWLMTDDIYEHLLYDGRTFATALNLQPGLRDRTLVINGVSKAYAMTGWRLGYCAGPASLIEAMSIVQSQATTNPSSISQAAAIEALTGPQDIVAQRRDDFQRRRDIVVERLNAMPGISCRKPEGAFYTFANCSGLLGRRTPEGAVLDSDSTYCRYLLEEANVAVVPGSCFGLAPYFRISYAAAQETLMEACDRISRANEALR